MRTLCLLLIFLATVSHADDVDVYGFNMHYTDSGSGPAIVLLHGLWGGTNEWLPVIEPLAETHRIVVVDAIGFHGSDKPEAQYHNALLAEFLAGFIKTLGLEDVTLMGHAMGANLATYTAVHHPENIARLVLVDGAGYRNPDRDLSRPMSAGMINFRRIATGSNIAATERFLRRRVLDKNLVSREWAEDAFSMWLKSARAIGDMLMEGGDVTPEEMRTIKIPTLVIWGSGDAVFPIENAERLRNDIAGAQIQIIDASGHLPQLERPGAFLAVVLPFLRSDP